MDVSICIPAHNEEVSLRDCVDAAVQQEVEGDLEVLVCTNGSTDRTPEIAERLEKEYPPVHHLTTTGSGKAHAWNILTREATYDSQVHTDADTVMLPGAAQRLAASLGDDDILVAGYTQPCLDHVSGIDRLMASLKTTHTWVSGKLYGFSRDRLFTRFSELGYFHMPEDLLGDDAWLSLVAGDDWHVEAEAKVLYHPPSWEDRKKAAIRAEQSRLQIMKKHPRLIERNDYLAQHPFGMKFLADKAQKFLKTEGAGNKIKQVGRFFLHEYLRFYAGRNAEHGEQHDGTWPVLYSTKRSFAR